MDGLKRYVNDDRFRVDGDKNMRLLAFAFTIVFVWTGPKFVKTHLTSKTLKWTGVKTGRIKANDTGENKKPRFL